MENQMKAAELIADLLDNRFQIFGFKFGINAILDLVPELGDIIAAALSLYLIYLAYKMRAPTVALFRMLANIIFSLIIGLIPVLGDSAYLFYKPNMRNLQILKDHYNNGSVKNNRFSTSTKLPPKFSY